MLDKEAVILTVKDILHFFTCFKARCFYVYAIFIFIVAKILNTCGVDMEQAVVVSIGGSLSIAGIFVILYVTYQENLDEVERKRLEEKYK